jgi:hypothetical protein
MALRLSDRTLENIAAVTCLLGAFIVAVVLLQIGGALLPRNPVRGTKIVLAGEQGSWVITTCVVVLIVGVAWATNLAAVRRNNSRARRLSNWGGYMSAGGHIAYATFYFAWRTWQA